MPSLRTPETDVTDYELHRKEFLTERLGMILEDHPELDEDEAMARAIDIWNAMQELAGAPQ